LLGLARQAASGRTGAWRPDGKLVSIDQQHVLRCWDPASGKVLVKAALKQPDQTVRVALAAHGGLAAVLVNRGRLRLVDAATGQVRHDLPVPGPGDLVHLTPDGRHVIVGRRANGTVWLWDAVSGKRLQAFPKAVPGFDRITALAPDGATLAVRGGDIGTYLEVVDLRRQKRRGPLRSPSSITSLAFSADGKLLAAGNVGGKVLLWDLSSDRRAGPFDVVFGTVSALAFSGDGKRLAAGSGEGVEWLASGDRDGAVLLWRAPPQPPG
jgi:WD40 repeat protein